MWVVPRRKLPSFLNIFRMSRPLAKLGARVAIEFSQSTLLVLASSAMTWLLLVGVSLQSLAKQMMFCPDIGAVTDARSSAVSEREIGESMAIADACINSIQALVNHGRSTGRLLQTGARRRESWRCSPSAT